jgi:hypothetical protein
MLCYAEPVTSFTREKKMNISEMIVRLTSDGMVVSRVPDCGDTLHVDGYHGANGKGLPDWIYSCPKWGVSSCGFGRVFMFRVG